MLRYLARPLFMMASLVVVFPSLGQQPSIYVRLLGTGGPSIGGPRAEAGLLVVAGTEILLFDCGNGIPDHLAQIGRLSAVNKVFLTHLHSDHTEGLPVLWMNWNACAGRGNAALAGQVEVNSESAAERLRQFPD